MCLYPFVNMSIIFRTTSMMVSDQWCASDGAASTPTINRAMTLTATLIFAGWIGSTPAGSKSHAGYSAGNRMGRFKDMKLLVGIHNLRNVTDSNASHFQILRRLVFNNVTKGVQMPLYKCQGPQWMYLFAQCNSILLNISIRHSPRS